MIFGMFNDLAVGAIRSRTECIGDANIEALAAINLSHADVRVSNPPLP
jgi:hypothetical protein